MQTNLQLTLVLLMKRLLMTFGVVLLAVFAGVSGFDARHFGTRGSGNLGKNPGQ